MVRLAKVVVAPWLALALSCSARVGTVLIARDEAGEPDAALTDANAMVALDAGDAPSDTGVDLARDAIVDAAPADAAIPIVATCRTAGASSGFYEDFSGSALSESWLIAHGSRTFAGSTPRGGFVRENVTLRDGALILTVRGDRYDGPVRGIDGAGNLRADGVRSGAAVATRDLFASGTYQAQGRFVAPAGVEVALWVMADDDRTGGIDIAVPGSLQGADGGAPSYSVVRMRSRTGREASASTLQQYPLAQSLDDGQSHILRFDWYSTGAPSVQFWVDDVARFSIQQTPVDGATRRFFLVAFVPDDAPADFASAEVRFENAFVTPFGNSGDRCTASETTGVGLIAPR